MTGPAGSPGSADGLTFGDATINCSRNAYLCGLLNAGGDHGGTCEGACVMRALKMLSGRGIDLSHIVAVAHGNGKIVNVKDGPQGDGIYFVGDGRSTKLAADTDPTCGLACSFGRGAQAALGCESETSCVVQGALIFGGGEECALLRRGLARIAARRAAGDAALLWPRTAEEMDAIIGTQGTRIPDGPMTPGRGKVVWRPNSSTKITYEQHPYHPDAPEWHRGPHWHLDTPGSPHQRYVPGDPIPGYDGN